jgi:hypothetical protein
MQTSGQKCESTDHMCSSRKPSKESHLAECISDAERRQILDCLCKRNNDKLGKVGDGRHELAGARHLRRCRGAIVIVRAGEEIRNGRKGLGIGHELVVKLFNARLRPLRGFTEIT